MEKKAIPCGYMTVGEVAKKMGVTVRTLQYYDRVGLLSPSAESEGGRRLYTDKDLIQLHQILSLKHLGFSLEEIKNNLVSLENPEEVANVLSEQAAAVQRKIEALTEALKDIEMLKEEVKQMQTVDFKKYADIIVNLQMKNEYYWLIKYFDDEMLDHIRSRFNQNSGLTMINTFQNLREEAIHFKNNGVRPESEKGQALAKAFWDMVMEFTGGDMSMLPKLMEMGKFDSTDPQWQQKQAAANEFIEPALDIYFTKLGINPFGEETK